MPLAHLPASEQWDDLIQSLDFVERRFADWKEQNALPSKLLEDIRSQYQAQRTKWAATRTEGQNVPADIGLPLGYVGESAASRSLRYWTYVGHEVRRFTGNGRLSLARSHELLAEVRERQAALECRLKPEELPEALLVPEAQSEAPPTAARAETEAAPAPTPRRNLLEILLDPRNIQMLLAIGGALMLVGLVILLAVNDYFTPPVLAVSLGVANAVLLGAGWWVLRATRYQLAGRALTLMACLIMPLNLWFYHANDLLKLDGHLWVGAVVISALYATSALVLRDEWFVYIFTAGVTMTGLLVLADIPPSPDFFWEIASPATLLVVLGLLAIHIERAFPELDGPFGRRRFGLAFFWSGHTLLAAGLLLVLGAEIAGDWLYQPIFKNLYERWHATPSPIVGELRWLALALVVAGTYAYIYSDVVVRHVGVYVHIAAGTLLWSFVLGLQVLGLKAGLDAWIAVLAATALIANIAQATILNDSRYTKAFPVLGVLLPLMAVALGLLVYFKNISPDLKSVWPGDKPEWSYVGAMLLTAVSCRVGAYLYRASQPRLALSYFFATAAATLVGATALLTSLGLDTWQGHAPLLMLVPIVYVVAARLYRGRPEEMPLLWVSHAATAVMLLSGLASALEGFGLVKEQRINLVLALFCAEAAAFYILATVFHRQVWTIHLSAAMACGAVWQLLTYMGVAAEYYTLTFALVGLGLLVVYRFAIIERFSAGPLADAAFQSGNTLLSLSFVAAVFIGLSHLAKNGMAWVDVGLFGVLIAISLCALALVRHAGWRRWYVVTAIGQTALMFLGITLLGHMSLWVKLEIFSVAVGFLLLVAGHIGWYREQERHSDLVSLSLLLGSLLVGLPLAAATLPSGSAVAQGAVLPNAQLLLVAVLANGSLLKQMTLDIGDAAPNGSAFAIFVPDLFRSIRPEDALEEFVSDNADLGAPRATIFELQPLDVLTLGVTDELRQRLLLQQFNNEAEDLLNAFQRALEQIQHWLARQPVVQTGILCDEVEELAAPEIELELGKATYIERAVFKATGNDNPPSHEEIPAELSPRAFVKEVARIPRLALSILPAFFAGMVIAASWPQSRAECLFLLSRISECKVGQWKKWFRGQLR